MRTVIRWMFGALIVAGITVLLVWAFLEGRAELAREREREKPVQVPPRVSRVRRMCRWNLRPAPHR
jgi:hypothetical protein